MSVVLSTFHSTACQTRLMFHLVVHWASMYATYQIKLTSSINAKRYFSGALELDILLSNASKSTSYFDCLDHIHFLIKALFI